MATTNNLSEEATVGVGAIQASNSVDLIQNPEHARREPCHKAHLVLAQCLARRPGRAYRRRPAGDFYVDAVDGCPAGRCALEGCPTWSYASTLE